MSVIDPLFRIYGQVVEMGMGEKGEKRGRVCVNSDAF